MPVWLASGAGHAELVGALVSVPVFTGAPVAQLTCCTVGEPVLKMFGP